jgi:hypothetical protein
MGEKVPQGSAARCCGVSPRTLEKWRVSGDGPPFYKVGKKVVYDVDELNAWMASRRRRNTSEAA